MDRESISKVLNRRLFEAFELHLSSGDVVVVKHPENAFLTKAKILVVDPVTDGVDIVALLHVTSVRTLQTA